MLGGVSVALFAAVSVVLAGAAGADPVSEVSANMWGSDTGYTASAVGRLTAIPGVGGAPLPISGANFKWGATSGRTSLDGFCVLGLALHLEVDTSTGAVGFDCFALGHGIDLVDSSAGVTVYQAYLFGNVHVTLTPEAGAAVDALAYPAVIGFPNRPGGWATLWAHQSIACMGEQPCELEVST